MSMQGHVHVHNHVPFSNENDSSVEGSITDERVRKYSLTGDENLLFLGVGSHKNNDDDNPSQNTHTFDGKYRHRTQTIIMENIDPDTIRNKNHSLSNSLSTKNTAERERNRAQFLESSQNFFYLYIIPYFFGKKKAPTYEDLLKLEAYRKTVVRKSYRSGLLLLMTWDATILRYVFSDFQFWFSLGIYAFMRFYITPNQLLQSPVTGISAIGSIMSILLVYYLNNGFSRYTQIYYVSMSCQGRIFDLSFMCRSYLSIEKSMTIWRYMNAAHVLGYMSFSRIHSEDNFWRPLNDKHKFLTEVEYETLKAAYDLRSGGSGYREVLEWAIEELEEEVSANRLSQFRAFKIFDQLSRLRGAIGSLVDYKDMPVPFVYVHYINVMCILYLPLFAFLVAFGFQEDERTEFIGFFVVVLNSIFVLGRCD